MTPLFAKTVTYGWQWYQESAGKPKQNRLTDITYPSGRGFTFDYTRDGQTWTNAIGRMTGMSEVGGTNNPLIAYTTTGGGRNVKKVWGGNAVTLDYTPSTEPERPAGFDRFGRVTTMDFQKADASTIHKYAYGYNANGNRTYARITQAGHPNDRSFLYGYDNLNRLVHAERGILNSLNNAILPNGKGQAWNLDVLGNWSGGSSNDSFISYTVGSLAGNNPGYDSTKDAWTEKRHDTTDEANRINTLRTEANGGSVDSDDFYYDRAGNLVLDDEKFYKYDAWNRVVEVHDKGDYHVDAAGDLAGSDLGDLIGQYEYDAIGRRIAKTLGTAASPTDYFYYDGHRVLEHHKHDGTSLALQRQYVYGLDYIDEVVAYYDSDQTAAAPHFILQDANYNVVATTDHEGYLEQQYNYKPYGERLAAERIEADGGITDILATPEQIALPLGFKGLWYDTETASWHNRARDYVPSLGRFRQRDPYRTALLINTAMLRNAQTAMVAARLSAGAQYHDGLHSYEYLRGNPLSRRDASGTRSLAELLTVGGATSALYASLGGAVVGSVGNAVGAWATGGDIGKAAISGAMSGFAGGLAFASGAGILVMGAIEGAIQAGADAALRGDPLKEVLTDAVGGAIIGGASAKYVGRLVRWAGRKLRIRGAESWLQDRIAKGVDAVGFDRYVRVVADLGMDAIAGVDVIFRRSGLGSGDVDLWTTAGTLIEVGGGAKGMSAQALDKFRSKLKTLVGFMDGWSADDAVNFPDLPAPKRVMFYYDTNTPESAVNLAVDILGSGNVVPIS